MTGFIERLEEWTLKDSKVRAILRRSLTFDPGQFTHAFRYVEPFLKAEESNWRREMHYLVAGLWAAHWKEGHSENKLSLAVACAHHMESSGSGSTEDRFIAVIDADGDQLPHRLRHLVALLKDYPIDFSALLRDLVHWKSERKSSQNAWAREFYRLSSVEKAIPTKLLPENI